MKIFTRILTAGLGLLVLACNHLEVDPVSQISAEQFFKSANDVEAAVIGCYDGLQNYSYSRDVVLTTGIMADEFFATRGGNFTGHQDFNPSPGQGNVGDFWRESYFTIHRCQDVVENIGKVTDPALNRDRALGEVFFIRALTYFNLTRLYGKIPLLDRTTKSPNQQFDLPRNEVSDVYQAIIDDLLEAEELLPVTNGSKMRATKGAARALLARVYLHRQQPGDVALALTECEEVMADNQYQLVSTAAYADLFAVGKQNTAESIFEISYRPNTQQEGGSNLDGETVPAAGNSFRAVPEEKFINTIDANPDDIRRNVILATHNKVTYVRKYEAGPPSVTNNRRVQDPNIIVLRLADVILMRAEALNELGRTSEAIPLLNQIRQRAGLAPTTAATPAEVKLAIENERYIELAFEGHRWFDLVRWNKAVGTIPSLTDPGRILWPVPSRELDLNPNLLPQNPSY